MSFRTCILQYVRRITDKLLQACTCIRAFLQLQQLRDTLLQLRGDSMPAHCEAIHASTQRREHRHNNTTLECSCMLVLHQRINAAPSAYMHRMGLPATGTRIRTLHANLQDSTQWSETSPAGQQCHWATAALGSPAHSCLGQHTTLLHACRQKVPTKHQAHKQHLSTPCHTKDSTAAATQCTQYEAHGCNKLHK